MNGEKISRQLNFLPEDMIAEAMDAPAAPRRFTATARILRAAACFAVIIGLLFGIRWYTNDHDTPSAGLLTVTVHGVDLKQNTNIAEDLLLLPYTNVLFPGAINSYVGFPIGLSVTDGKYDLENISFRVSADGGWIFAGELGNIRFHQAETSELDTSKPIPNNTAIFWKQVYPGAHPNFSGNLAFVEIIVYEGTQIIGYAVIQLDREHHEEYGYTRNFYVSMPVNKIFVSKEAVTEEYVRQQIEEVKKSIKNALTNEQQ